MVRFFAIFFVWICNKRGGFLSPCFPLDLFYCYRNFISQNWPRKFVNQSRMADQRDGGRKFQHRPPTSALAAANVRYTLQAALVVSACWQCAPLAACNVRRFGLFPAYRRWQTRHWWRVSSEKGLNSVRLWRWRLGKKKERKIWF